MFEKIYSYLNKLVKLSFEDSLTEKRFQAEYQSDHIGQNNIAILAGLLAYIFYLPVSYLFTPEDFYVSFIIIITIPIPLSILFLYMIRTGKFKKKLLFNLFTYGIGIGIPPALVLLFTQDYHQVYINNFLLVIFSIFVMYGVPLIIALLTISILILATLLALFASSTQLSFENIAYDLYLIVITFMISFISGYLMEQSKRKNYLAKYKQEELSEKLLEEQTKVRLKDKQLLESKLAQMGEMISMIAHQWRQPLNAISATTNNLTVALIMDDIDKDEFTKEIELISGYSQHLSRTIDDFRNFYKNDKEKEVTTLENIVNETLAITSLSLENKNIKVQTNIYCKNTIEIIVSEFKQVLLNLIKNAEDALVENSIENGQITIEVKCQRNRQIVIIKDNAGGIPEDIIDRVFEPYFSTKKQKDGTGLGLYMSKTIIEEHCGGELSVKNDEDGALFSIKLGSIK